MKQEDVKELTTIRSCDHIWIGNEIWELIFSFLSKSELNFVALVSKCWRDFISEHPPGHWKQLSLRGPESELMEVPKMMRFRKLETIEIHSCHPNRDSSDELLESIANCCKHLKCLKINANNVTDWGIRHVADGCPNIQELHLNLCQVTDQGLAFISTCQHLERFQFHLGNQVSNQGLEVLAHGCHRLKDLIMTGGHHITEEGIKALAKGCPNIIHLVLEGFENLKMNNLEVVKLFPKLERHQVLRGKNPFIDFTRGSSYESWLFQGGTIVFNDF